jgi:predicted nucleic acid-binding protein
VTLVDTSVWVAHLRSGHPELRVHLEHGAVYGHPFVTGEIACGSLRNRQEVLDRFDALPQAPSATELEVRTLLERRALHGRGIGWIDAHLIASALLAKAPLWTLDRRLHAAAEAVGVVVRSDP